MRKIIASQYLSLDGVPEDPVGMEGSGLGDWVGPFTRGLERHRQARRMHRVWLGYRHAQVHVSLKQIDRAAAQNVSNNKHNCVLDV